MESEYHHRVLIVSDDAQTGKAVKEILQKENLEAIYEDNGDAALKKIRTCPSPFSLIVSDQKMPGMKGTQFFEHAKKLNPDTIRVLITGYSKMENIINAVNKGSVHRYISKPWDREEMLLAIRSGIKLYERSQNNKKLISLAKKQNAKLYELNCELMEATKAQNKVLSDLDAEIESMETQLKQLEPDSLLTPVQVMEEISAFLETNQENRQDALSHLFSETVQTLFEKFNNLALRNGFEMQEKLTGNSND